MKVLVLNGSPKSECSNTMRLTRAFLDGAGWSNAEVIDVAKADIKACLGCFVCWHTTPGKCVINDGMGKILTKMIAADVIVWSFPLYYYNVPSGLKNLIDRQLPLSLPFMEEGNESGSHPSRYNLTHQKHVVISTCGFWTSIGNYEAVTAMFDHFCGKNNYITIFCGQGELFSVPELKNRTDTYLEVVRRTGEEYVAGGIRNETREELAEPLYPRNVFEKMADASWRIEKEECPKTPTDDSLSFTRQMAALYKPDGVERVIEFHYTDIEKTYQILLTKQGSEVITDNVKSYTTRIETPYSVWRSIACGEITGQKALFQRLYKVIGDFDIMLKWDDLFGTQTPPLKRTEYKTLHKTQMPLFLVPWIIIWTGIPINPVVGSAISIVAATVIPLLWLLFRPVVYERISILIVAGLSLAVLLGADARIIVSGSYLLFGLLWIIGSFPQIPLTAHYSSMGYGGEKAFANPLFILTNRILTAAWGAIYLVTPIWTYVLMGTELSPYVGLINSILPALMGLFTAWFQKWYPAQYARG
ncbi:Multimeric flavodoxin WrbA [Anaerovirgula multivorans]|uniref:Multimeric flavodoxin WrbA n=1 Tax=Anaerovirgula multivorans TaxID=312168 RepID=A0A239LDU4_9FIRM|nr:NAD(P)H-dependent oxidoreductase [Anaerovirgula multivorans]SNT28480.1 Multimeric flavodoxin WrbA [Anaerovirgula multivorans]